MIPAHATRLVAQRPAELELGLEPTLDRAGSEHVVFHRLAVADDPVVADDEQLERPERRELAVRGLAVVEELQIDALLGTDHSSWSA